MNAPVSLPLLDRLAGWTSRPAQVPAGRRAPALHGERLARARLARTPRIGPVTFHEMLGHFGSAEAALDALPSLARRAGFAQAPVPPPAHALRREADALARLGGRFVVCGDADYPALLAQIPDAPPLLSAIGDLGLLGRPTLAVVGARNCSTNGRRLATSFAGALGAEGFVVVSGMARGIDTAAHRAALDTGTVAVLAGGVDVIYPPENEDLHRDITARGLVLAEAPPGAVPQARHFPRRNRIVSGLSRGVLVIEAALQSGSLITARQAADQGREVFAVPGSPLDPRCRGSNRLLRDGAHVAEEASDIVAQLGRPAARHDRAASPSPQVTRGNCPARPPRALPRSPAGPSTEPSQLTENAQEFLEDRILACLGRSPTLVDELVRECHVSAALVTAALLDLELSGKVERLQGNSVVLI
jgi:DNA processing protein